MKKLTISILVVALAAISFLNTKPLYAANFPSFATKFAGDYRPTFSYSKGDIVKYGSKSYVALSKVPEYISPTYDSAYWTVFAELPSTQFGGSSTFFTLEFVTIGNPGNSNDTTGYGNVPYVYQIGTYDITQNQINAAANAGLVGMPAGDWSGDQPATSISWYQAAAFVNWLNTNEGYAPAYNLSYTNGSYILSPWSNGQEWTKGGKNYYRNENCNYFLPSENEWYKAAYYDPTKNNGKGGYWQYPEGLNTPPTPVASGTAARTAVYNGVALSPTSVYEAGGLSPYGTVGQGGNVWQWIESANNGSNINFNAYREVRGGAWYDISNNLKSTLRYVLDSPESYYGFGFRVARILP